MYTKKEVKYFEITGTLAQKLTEEMLVKLIAKALRVRASTLDLSELDVKEIRELR
jgi:hypothetical protein